MSYMTFVVKGLDMSGECSKRGIKPVVLVTETKRESVYATTPENLALVAQWFADTPSLVAGYGYPDGTCLIYSFHENDGSQAIRSRLPLPI
jgi:hypothetical protein